MPEKAEEMKTAKKTERQEAAGESRFSKEQLLASKRYRPRRDCIAALLRDGQEYTLEEVDARLRQFEKGRG